MEDTASFYHASRAAICMAAHHAGNTCFVLNNEQRHHTGQGKGVLLDNDVVGQVHFGAHDPGIPRSCGYKEGGRSEKFEEKRWRVGSPKSARDMACNKRHSRPPHAHRTHRTRIAYVSRS